MTSRNKISSKRTNIIGIGIIIIAVIATIMMLDLSATTFTEQSPSDYENEEYGVIETKFNNGDIKFETRQKSGRYKTHWHRDKSTKGTLIDRFQRALVDIIR